MSGGSFNYLESTLDVHGLDGLVQSRDTLVEMAEALEELDYAGAPAQDTRELIRLIDQLASRAEELVERLGPVWGTVERWYSADCGEDRVRTAVAKYSAATDPEA